MISARRFAALLCVGMTGAASAAAPSPAEDSKTVARCIDAARKDGGFAGNCIGAVADPCIKAARERDTAVEDAKACARRELGVWTARMRNALALIGKSGGKDMLASVTAAQKTWAASQNKLCPLFANIDPGAALGGADYCRLQETARRALVLERLGAAVSEH